MIRSWGDLQRLRSSIYSSMSLTLGPGNVKGSSREATVNRLKLLSPRDAARILGVSYPTLKQWIYKKKLQTVKTAGGHHRIPEGELDKFLHLRTKRSPVRERRENFRRISGRNQLIGRITEITIDGLLAQVRLSIGGQQITSIITADAAREMRLRIGDTVGALIKSTEVMIVRS